MRPEPAPFKISVARTTQDWIYQNPLLGVPPLDIFNAVSDSTVVEVSLIHDGILPGERLYLGTSTVVDNAGFNVCVQ